MARVRKVSWKLTLPPLRECFTCSAIAFTVRARSRSVMPVKVLRWFTQSENEEWFFRSYGISPSRSATAIARRASLANGKTEALGCNRMDSRADQPAAVFTHPENILRGNRIGSDRKIRLALAVIEIVEEDELPVPQRRERLVNHGPTSTLTLSESSTPSFRRSAMGAITSMMSSG